MSNTPEQQKLEPILKEVRPDNWQEILEKYERFSKAKRQELSDEIQLDDDKVEAVDLLVDDLTQAGLDADQKAVYVDTLEAMLDAQFGVTLDEAVERYETEKDKIFGTEAEKKPLSYNELIESYKRVEALFPTLQESESLSDDASELLMAIKEQMVGMKTIELVKGIKDELKNDAAYLTVEEVTDEESGNTSLQVVKTGEFEGLSGEEQARLERKILELTVNVVLKQEEALLDVESRDYMRAFYQANQALNGGSYKKAKDLYKKFLKHHEGDAGIKPEALEEPTVARAIEGMKRIADLEIELVTGKLDSFSRSVRMIPRVSWNINKLGVSKDAAERMIEAQRKTLEAATTLIKKNPSVLSLEDAITLIGGINEVQSQEADGGNADRAYLMEIGLCDSIDDATQFLGDSNYGDWRSRGIAFYASKFGTNHKWGEKKLVVKDAKYVSQLDALGQFLETGADEANMTKDQLRQKAEYYQEIGLYDAAEQMYDRYFEGLYKYHTQRQSFEDYEAAFRKDPEKMEDIKEQIETLREGQKEKDGSEMSEEEVKFRETYLIKEARKADIRANITENMKRSGDVDPKLAEEWGDYNNDYLQTDRHWLELWEMTNAEEDSFIETLPIDLVTLAVSGYAAKKVVEFGARKLAAEELLKMSLREAFKKGGRTAAMKVLAEAASLGVESAVFSEMNMAVYALRTGDMTAEGSLKAHLKAWGHSAMVLGVLKGVNVPFAKLNGVPGAKAAAERVGGRILIDTVALTGMNVLTGMVSGNGEIAADIRNNILLSVGVRAGQGLAAFGRGKLRGEGPKSPDAEGKVGEKAKGARETGPIAERIERGGEVEMRTEKDLDQAFEVFGKEGYEVGVNEKGQVKATKTGKPDVILREGGELAKKRSALSNAVENARTIAESNAEPSKIAVAIEGLANKLIEFGVKKPLARLLAAYLVLTPRGARAAGGGWETTGSAILGFFGNLPIIVTIVGALVVGVPLVWKTTRGAGLRGRVEGIGELIKDVNKNTTSDKDLGDLTAAVENLEIACTELGRSRSELLTQATEIGEAARNILNAVEKQRDPSTKAEERPTDKAITDLKGQLTRKLKTIPLDWFARNARLPGMPGQKARRVLKWLTGIAILVGAGSAGLNWYKDPGKVGGMSKTVKGDHINPELVNVIVDRNSTKIKYINKVEENGVEIFNGEDGKKYKRDDDGYAVEIKTVPKTKEQ